MTTHTFTLVLHPSPDFTEETAASLYASGCDDALVATRSGIPYLDFDREAESFSDAILSAIHDVENCTIRGKAAGLCVRRVEPYDLVNAAEIARRANITREYVRLLASGRRGTGGFPAPVCSCAGKALWSWASVSAWLTAANIKVKHRDIDLRTVELVNAALTTRDCKPSSKEMGRIKNALFSKRRSKQSPSRTSSAVRRGAAAR